MFWSPLGTDLPARTGGGKVDAFVALHLGRDGKKLGSTSVAKDAAPGGIARWSFEHCLSFPSPQESLLLHLYHHNAIFKNELLGSATLDLAAVSSTNANQKGQALRMKLERGTGTLLVLVRVLQAYAGMPLDTSLFYSLRPYSPIRLHLDRYIWLPGETVRGCIVFSGAERSPTPLSWLHLESIGRTHFEFRSQDTLGVPARRDLNGKCYISPFDFLWWSARATVFDLTTDKLLAPPTIAGPHAWPFEFTLPQRLPPTYTRQSYSSTYTVQVHAHIDGKVITISKDIVIVPPLTSFQPSLTSSVLLSSVAPEVAAPNNLPIALSWGTTDIAQIGVPFIVSFQLQNMSHYHFTSFTCHLRTMRVYNIYAAGRNEWLANTFLEEISASPLPNNVQSPANTIVNGQVQMLASNTPTSQCCYPSIPEGVFTDLLQVHHWLELIGYTAVNNGEMVSLGKRPIFVTYAQFVPPFESSNALELSSPPSSSLPGSPIAFFRVAKATNDQALSLSIPQGHWVHKYHQLTQERSNLSAPQLSSTSYVLPHEAFEALHPITPKHTAANTSQTVPFPISEETVVVEGVATTTTRKTTAVVKLEHAESFQGLTQTQIKNHQHGKGDAATITINQHLGVNLSYQPFGLNDLNRSLFGGGGFGK